MLNSYPHVALDYNQLKYTDMRNAKAFYEDNKDIAEVTYAWFSARVKAMHENLGKDEPYLFRSSTHYLLDPKQAIFTEMLKRGWVGNFMDTRVNVHEVTTETKKESRKLKVKSV